MGFGDITPTNECEVFVTILVELSGSAVFGYLINIIGMTMSELKYLRDHAESRDRTSTRS